MKRRVEPFRLHFTNDDGEELLTAQNYGSKGSILFYGVDTMEFNVHKKTVDRPYWQRIHKPNAGLRAYFDGGLAGRFYQDYGGGLQVTEVNRTDGTVTVQAGGTYTARARTGYHQPVILGLDHGVTFGNGQVANEIPLTVDTETDGFWGGWQDPWIDEAPTHQPTAQEIVAKHQEHLRQHQRMLEAQQQAAAEMRDAEARRREMQRIAQQERDEAERNRPRRPWDRVRDMFR